MSILFLNIHPGDGSCPRVRDTACNLLLTSAVWSPADGLQRRFCGQIKVFSYNMKKILLNQKSMAMLGQNCVDRRSASESLRRTINLWTWFIDGRCSFYLSLWIVTQMPQGSQSKDVKSSRTVFLILILKWTLYPLGSWVDWAAVGGVSWWAIWRLSPHSSYQRTHGGILCRANVNILGKMKILQRALIIGRM